jgi:cytoskeletal protein CcmA (bactofilin family)
MLRCSSYTKEIGGETINIRKDTPNKQYGILIKLLIWLSGGKHGKLTVDWIEGTNVYVEDTEAKIIRGEKIVIGPRCRVESIEYSESLDIDAQAEVLSHNRI